MNQGMCDELTHAFERALPNTEFSTVFMPQARIGIEFERNANLCFPCMIYNPGQHDRVYFTEPTHWYPPHGVITTHELAAELTEQFGNPIELSALLESEQYYLAYPHGRKFGDLQPILESHSSQNSYRIVRTGDNAPTAILAMIRANRVHYTIDYPILVEYDKQTAESDMAFIPIAENQNSVVIGAIGCTKNAWGERAVQHLNRGLPAIRNDEQFMARLAMYYNNIPDYFERYEQLIRQHQRETSPQTSPDRSDNQPELPSL
ncbi:hypothetical protein [Lysobacter sp. N42]|uniref:hypothetical protein n=1 Tax=Lysobacter sp. N42 TaxID=2545719 RepID=UPI001404F899|nr:hypothetical protein [Lysobacter sp. N42]